MKSKVVKKLLSCILATGMVVSMGITSSAAGESGWKVVDGEKYWYEDGVRQGYNPDDPSYRGKEIYDPETAAWYWLDNVLKGAVAKDKDVYQESKADDEGNIGKWVRYDSEGHMIKGWNVKDGNIYYFNLIYGTMAKGDVVIDGENYHFDPVTGILDSANKPVLNGWKTVDGKDYWYENGVRQGYDPNDAAYRGKEIYDPGTNAWYWLDNVQNGAKAVSKDVYQESKADDAGNIGKWVRYDADGHMVKGWDTNANGTYYFDLVYGTMLKGFAEIDGFLYYFDLATGTRYYSCTVVIDGTEYEFAPDGKATAKRQVEYLVYSSRTKESVTTYNSGKVSNTVYEYEDPITEKNYYRSVKETTTTAGVLEYVYTYKYDDNGNTLESTSTYYDKEGKETSKYIHIYERDANGKTLKEHNTEYSNGTLTRETINTYEYDANGRRTKEHYGTYRNGELASFYAYTYEYDANGNQTKYNYYSSDAWREDKLVCVYEYTYNEQGLKTVSARTDYGSSEDSLYRTKEYYSYDQNGHKTEELYVVVGEDGTERESSKTIYEGNEIGTKYVTTLCLTQYKSDDEWVDSYKEVYTYDSIGSELSEIDYDITYDYDDSGKRVAKEQPSREYYHTYYYEKDSDGSVRWSSTKTYDYYYWNSKWDSEKQEYTYVRDYIYGYDWLYKSRGDFGPDADPTLYWRDVYYTGKDTNNDGAKEKVLDYTYDYYSMGWPDNYKVGDTYLGSKYVRTYGDEEENKENGFVRMNTSEIISFLRRDEGNAQESDLSVEEAAHLAEHAKIEEELHNEQ